MVKHLGQFNGLRSVIIAGLLVSGCGRADVKACEEFVKSGLVSPSSYKLVSAHPEDMTLKEPDRKARVITLEFDAQNVMGGTIRDRAYCEFRYDAYGNLPTDRNMLIMAKGAAARRDLIDMGKSGAFGPREDFKGAKPISCCN